jgi:SNF2 family DNA or RNA helicase
MHYEQIPHKYEPRENQKVAIENAVNGLTNHGFHGLFLEMSMGKSKVALNTAEILRQYGALNQMVIVCPKAIQPVWLEEIPKHSHFEAEPLIWENSTTNKYLQKLRAFKQQKEFKILIVRLELFQRECERLEIFLNDFLDEPTVVVLDESSKIKNVVTNRTPRLISLTRQAAYKLILTGTPWTESPLDIFSQMEFMKEGFWYMYEGPWRTATLRKHWYIFRNRYAIMQDITLGGGRSFKSIVGTRRTEEIAKKIQPYITQQKKVDWLDLPEKIKQTLTVEMPKKQAKAYHTMKELLILQMGDEILTAQNAGTLLVRLRQLAGGFYPETGEPIEKVPAGIEMLLEDVAEYTGKVVIAASFVAEIRGIVSALSTVYGRESVATYYGATKDRDNEIARFRDDPKVRFLVVNPQSAGYGLNLQFASLMYLYSRPFSYEQNVQLEDRIHRPGMIGSAVYKDIIHKGTVQTKVIKAFERKKGVVDDFDRMTVREFLDL